LRHSPGIHKARYSKREARALALSSGVSDVLTKHAESAEARPVGATHVTLGLLDRRDRAVQRVVRFGRDRRPNTFV
jgi:hypothetical protein